MYVHAHVMSLGVLLTTKFALPGRVLPCSDSVSMYDCSMGDMTVGDVTVSPRSAACDDVTPLSLVT